MCVCVLVVDSETALMCEGMANGQQIEWDRPLLHDATQPEPALTSDRISPIGWQTFSEA